MRSRRPLLRVLSVIELVSVLVLLTNLATVHAEAVSSVMGPTHGAAYLAVIITTLIIEGAPTRARLLALVPAVGGVLALRTLEQQRADDHT